MKLFWKIKYKIYIVFLLITRAFFMPTNFVFCRFQFQELWWHLMIGMGCARYLRHCFITVPVQNSGISQFNSQKFNGSFITRSTRQSENLCFSCIFIKKFQILLWLKCEVKHKFHVDVLGSFVVCCEIWILCRRIITTYNTFIVCEMCKSSHDNSYIYVSHFKRLFKFIG